MSRLAVVAAVAPLGGLLFGYDAAVGLVVASPGAAPRSAPPSPAPSPTASAAAADVAFFAIGLGPVLWLLMAETFPLAIRGRTRGVCAVANWGANLVVSQVFLVLVDGTGSAATFGLFAVRTALDIAFAAACVPETKDRSLEQIDGDIAWARHGPGALLANPAGAKPDGGCDRD